MKHFMIREDGMNQQMPAPVQQQPQPQQQQPQQQQQLPRQMLIFQQLKDKLFQQLKAMNNLNAQQAIADFSKAYENNKQVLDDPNNWE